MAMAVLRSCLMSRISIGVSRQVRVYDAKAYHPRKWDFGTGDGTKRSGRGEIDDMICPPMERTIDHDMFDKLYAIGDFGDVDDEERRELVLDFMFHLEHVDIVPHDVTIRRFSTKRNKLGYTVKVVRPPWNPLDDDWKDYEEELEQQFNSRWNLFFGSY